MKMLVLFFTIMLASSSQAAELTPGTRLEIEHLFQHLEESGCQFNRNGTWYSASEASAHLRKKYDYLVKKDMLTNAESFIELAAKESSMSGKAYEVKCAGQNSHPSAVWFSEELKNFRSASKKAANGG